MKCARLIATAILLRSCNAQPFYGAVHKRQDALVVTQTVWVTVTAPDMVVWFDEEGNFVSESPSPDATPVSSRMADVQVAANPTVGSASQDIAAFSEELSTPPASEPISTHPVPQSIGQDDAPAPSYTSPPQDQPAPPPNPAKTLLAMNTLPFEASRTASPPAATPHPDNAGDGYSYNERSGRGVGWSNYNGDQQSSSCKSEGQADQEWAQMSDFDVVRIYGVDCGQPLMAFKLARKYNKKVFVGLYWLDDRFDQQINDIIDAVQQSGIGWGAVDTVCIGNEDVHRGELTPAEVIGFVNDARGQLSGAGYDGPVVHVDSQDAIIANPELCSQGAGDYIAANVHPFFNDHTTADQAGQFVSDQIKLLQRCAASQGRRRHNTRIRVVETGWPKDGDPNGLAVPSLENQKAALESIQSQDTDHLILFSAFDNKWMKDGAGTFNTETHWGILDG